MNRPATVLNISLPSTVKTIEQIQQDFKTYISQNHKEPALSQILDLWDRYMQYRQSLGEITHLPV